MRTTWEQNHACTNNLLDTVFEPLVPLSRSGSLCLLWLHGYRASSPSLTAGCLLVGPEQDACNLGCEIDCPDLIKDRRDRFRTLGYDMVLRDVIASKGRIFPKSEWAPMSEHGPQGRWR